MSDFIAGCCAVFIALAALIVGCVWGFNVGSTHVRNEAIANHFAHYAITNDATGETQFQWNKQPEKP